MMQSYPLHSGYPVENLDGLWEFAFRENMICREERCPEIRFDDVIPVPSCFDLQLPYRALRGTGFYRKQVNTRAGRIRLTCKGFGFIVTAYWDGVRVGESNLTYSEVSFDFESAEGRHELILAVSNVYDSRQAPLLYPYYDFYGYGGLYRSVELHQLPEYSVDRAEVRIVNAEEGRVRIRLRVSGTLLSPLSATFCFDGTQTVEQKLDASPEAEFVLDDKALWSPESPNLHTVRVQVGESVVTERFGLRTVKTEGRKLLLNGREIRLKGICRHESHVLFGVSVPHSLALEDVRLLKDLGCNFVRCVHYPQDSVFLDLCDELGMLVWEESLGWGNRAEQFLIPEFAEAQKEQTRLLTEKSINHPSIIYGSDLLEGKRAAGKKVLVVGGGMVGCETAAFLGEQNHEVTVIEFRDAVGADVIHEHRVYLMKDFEEYGIGQITGAKVCRFFEDGVEYETADGEHHEARGYDSVVLSMGYRNYNPLEEQVKAIVPDTYVIGDAIRARRALDATKEAYDVASQI